MTIENLDMVLESTNYPVAYYQFKTAQTIPFIVYVCDSEEDFKADDTHYKEIITGYIELYTNNKDTVAENKVRDALINNAIAFSKATEGHIDSQNLFYVRWYFTLV